MLINPMLMCECVCKYSKYKARFTLSLHLFSRLSTHKKKSVRSRDLNIIIQTYRLLDSLMKKKIIKCV